MVQQFNNDGINLKKKIILIYGNWTIREGDTDIIFDIMDADVWKVSIHTKTSIAFFIPSREPW